MDNEQKRQWMIDHCVAAALKSYVANVVEDQSHYEAFADLATKGEAIVRIKLLNPALHTRRITMEAIRQTEDVKLEVETVPVTEDKPVTAEKPVTTKKAGVQRIAKS